MTYIQIKYRMSGSMNYILPVRSLFWRVYIDCFFFRTWNLSKSRVIVNCMPYWTIEKENPYLSWGYFDSWFCSCYLMMYSEACDIILFYDVAIILIDVSSFRTSCFKIQNILKQHTLQHIFRCIWQTKYDL